MTDNLKEIQDAKVIINRLLQLINEAEAKFKSARNWGVADILGGGLIVNIVKHSKIDSANNVMELKHKRCAKAAMSQIQKRDYCSAYISDARRVMMVGINFTDKENGYFVYDKEVVKE